MATPWRGWRRVARWLRRRGLLDETRAEDRATATPDVAPLDACVALAQAGFDLHAGVTVSAWDDDGG